MPHCKKQMLSFFLTTKCNLCCRYCYNAVERNSIKEQTISLEIAEAAIDWYFANNTSRHIRFYGPGEPTQEFEKMKQITKYARKHTNQGTDVTVEIQTNGVFTEEVRTWLLNNVNIIWMSFDGTKDIQDYNRPLNKKYESVFDCRKSSDILEDNVRWLINNKEEKDLMVGARVTITDLNSSRQNELVDYFYDLGIRYVWTDPLFYSVDKVPVCNDLDKQRNFTFDMDRYIKNYIEAYYYAKSKGVFWGSFLTINFDGESYYHCRSCTPLSAPHITPDGFVSACDMVLGGEAYHMSLFIVGKWNETDKRFVWNYKRIDDLENRKSINIEHCKKCPVILHCGGYCLGEIVNETGRLDGQNIIKCAAVRKLYKILGPCDSYPYLHP